MAQWWRILLTSVLSISLGFILFLSLFLRRRLTLVAGLELTVEQAELALTEIWLPLPPKY